MLTHSHRQLSLIKKKKKKKKEDGNEKYDLGT
jgi:hypothetical protein